MDDPPTPYTGLTAGDILNALKDVPPETDIHIEGMVFYRWKWRGANLLALELNAVDEDFSPYHRGLIPRPKSE